MLVFHFLPGFDTILKICFEFIKLSLPVFRFFQICYIPPKCIDKGINNVLICLKRFFGVFLMVSKILKTIMLLSKMLLQNF